MKTSGGKWLFGDTKSPPEDCPDLAMALYRESLNFRVGNFKWMNPKLTGHLVHQDAWGNDASVLREELLQFFLSHGFWQATDVQICISDGGRAWARIGNLQRQNKWGQVKAPSHVSPVETWHHRRGLVFRLFKLTKEEQVLCIMSDGNESGAIFKQNWVRIKYRPLMQATYYHMPINIFEQNWRKITKNIIFNEKSKTVSIYYLTLYVKFIYFFYPI